MDGGTAITPSFPAPSATVGGGGGMHRMSEAEINSMRIAGVAERLATGIDYGVAKNEVPGHASILPPFLKQVCCRKNELALQAAIMVLMISVKNACKMGWFAAKDAEELLTLASEVGSHFGTINELSDEATDLMPSVSKIMSRFYPQLKLGHVIASLEVKPGYGTYVVDFHISKNMVHSQEDNIRLFVARKDDIDTSSCIINPQQVNFLLNGRGVKYRTNVFMALVDQDQGPQLPTVVNLLLKYGTNLLQAVGQSNGHYIIVIAFMSVIPPAALPMPQDYVQHATTSSSPDSEVIEGSSRICLNCPISFQRIRTPVKGYLCKHYQCFDLSNYLEVNLKQRPSWRCPHCGQSVCFTDLRVDQNMVKILREVEENISEVIISVDGSWTAVSRSNCKDQLQHKISANQQEGNELPDPSVNGHPSDNLCNVYDLTEEDNGMDTADKCEASDVKPVVVPNVQGRTVSTNSSLPPSGACLNEFNRYSSAQVGSGLSSGISLYESGAAGYTIGSEAQLGGISEALTGDPGVSPLTNAVSPLLSQQPDNFLGTKYPMSTMALGQISASSGLQSQEVLRGQSVTSNDFGMAPLIPRNVTRIPSAIQALPVQMPTPSPQEHSRPTMSVPGANGTSRPPQLPLISQPVGSNFERKRQFQRSSVIPINVSHMTSASLQNRSASQVMGHSTASNTTFRMPQTLSQPPHLSRSFRVPRNDNCQAGVLPAEMIAMGDALGTVQRVPLVAQQPAQMRRPQRPSPLQITESMTTGSSFALNSGGMPQAIPMTQPAQMRQPQQPTPLQITQSMTTGSSFALNSGGMPQAVSRTENLINIQSEQNWRPTGRMRGALTGEAYATALRQHMAQATQPAQAPSLPPRPTISASSPRNALLANRMNAHAQAQSHNQLFMATNATTITGSATTSSEGQPWAYRSLVVMYFRKYSIRLLDGKDS
ncbi:hypothetical protein Cgig2_001698 [Carnegiea gigantea]|uniref:SP-RING-type domain-containing protein n=1 Tax=Carnegiea gigantea TaxID=171969 RepID=A0A9Q1JKC4_9CARY|nr:hypothetical protein Cgig2_001698 [Carnegiea gigantea]